MTAVIRARGLCGSVGVLLLAGSLLFAQDAKKPEAAPGGAPKVQKRVPDNFGKLNLTEEQKTRIYAIQAANAVKIDELEAQLKALKEKQDADIVAVLTPDQAKVLATIRAEGKLKEAERAKARAERKKAGEEGDKKPDGDKKPTTDKKPVPEKKP